MLISDIRRHFEIEILDPKTAFLKMELHVGCGKNASDTATVCLFYKDPSACSDDKVETTTHPATQSDGGVENITTSPLAQSATQSPLTISHTTTSTSTALKTIHTSIVSAPLKDNDTSTITAPQKAIHTSIVSAPFNDIDTSTITAPQKAIHTSIVSAPFKDIDTSTIRAPQKAIHTSTITAPLTTIHTSIVSAPFNDIDTSTITAPQKAIHTSIVSAPFNDIDTSTITAPQKAIHTSIVSATFNDIDTSTIFAPQKAIHTSMVSAPLKDIDTSTITAPQKAIHTSIVSAPLNDIDTSTITAPQKAIHTSIVIAPLNDIDTSTITAPQKAIHTSIVSAPLTAIDTNTMSSPKSTIDTSIVSAPLKDIDISTIRTPKSTIDTSSISAPLTAIHTPIVITPLPDIETSTITASLTSKTTIAATTPSTPQTTLDTSTTTATNEPTRHISPTPSTTTPDTTPHNETHRFTTTPSSPREPTSACGYNCTSTDEWVASASNMAQKLSDKKLSARERGHMINSFLSLLATNISKIRSVVDVRAILTIFSLIDRVLAELDVEVCDKIIMNTAIISNHLVSIDDKVWSELNRDGPGMSFLLNIVENIVRSSLKWLNGTNSVNKQSHITIGRFSSLGDFISQGNFQQNDAGFNAVILSEDKTEKTQTGVVYYRNIGSKLRINELQNKYSNLKTSAELYINSDVVSLTSTITRPVLVEITFSLTHQTSEHLECVFLDSYSTPNVWSNQGCSLEHRNSTHVTCKCDHLTIFAILTSLYQIVSYLFT
ncbi:mucin-5AC-like [Physella acuta]|uniref:mucin-5AC-like n=1 Tax=Physella acuta TaxID=109671 RepID=UPI0027DB86F1|nr:mucin-5AC-like [Physella acuta]